MSQTSVHRAGPVLFASLLTAALALGLPHPPAAAQGVEFWNKECRKLLKQYDGKPRHKAFAASNMGAGGRQGQACGIAWGAGSKKQAEEFAIKVCRSQKSGNCWVTRSD